MGSYSPSTSTSDTLQTNNNNAGESGAIYVNLTKSRIGGTAAGGKSESKSGIGAGGAGAGGNGVAGQLNFNQTDHGAVDKAFALAELAMMESFGESRSLRQADSLALSTMADQVKTARQSDGGEGERLMKMAAVLVGVVVVVTVIFKR